MRTLAAAAVRPGRALPALRPARGCARAAAGSRAGGGMRARGGASGARALGEDARSRGRASGARMRVRARAGLAARAREAPPGDTGWLAGWLTMLTMLLQGPSPERIFPSHCTPPNTPFAYDWLGDWTD